ncbi:MAG: phosphatase PAP2 family protein [Burkholderiaceae bacterium]
MHRTRPWIASLAVVLTGACASPPTTLTEVGEYRPGTGLANGYLARGELPDSLALVPPPPAPGSAAQADDDEAWRALTALREGPRGKLATEDAALTSPPAPKAFACALGVNLNERDTPHLTMLLRRTLLDAGLATYKAKDHYQRQRPFVVHKAATCTPDEEAMLAKDGSYPSGHSAIGWAWALVLTQVAPERTDALLQRGRAFAQSRGVCGVHWKSDIENGRLVGSATVARLQGNAVFNAQLAAARNELASARASGKVPAQADCAAEAATLATSKSMAP